MMLVHGAAGSNEDVAAQIMADIDGKTYIMQSDLAKAFGDVPYRTSPKALARSLCKTYIMQSDLAKAFGDVRYGTCPTDCNGDYSEELQARALYHDQ